MLVKFKMNPINIACFDHIACILKVATQLRANSLIVFRQLLGFFAPPVEHNRQKAGLGKGWWRNNQNLRLHSTILGGDCGNNLHQGYDAASNIKRRQGKSTF